jgi:hypothetical protein
MRIFTCNFVILLLPNTHTTIIGRGGSFVFLQNHALNYTHMQFPQAIKSTPLTLLEEATWSKISRASLIALDRVGHKISHVVCMVLEKHSMCVYTQDSQLGHFFFNNFVSVIYT